MTDDEAPVRMHLVVAGRVQGVFYRASAARHATELALCGWVRNLPDGTVELVAEGSPRRCRELLEFCREGPPAARVQAIEECWTPARGGFEGFEVRY